MDKKHGFIIRSGRPEDVPRALQLIRELALYEKAPDAVEVSEESMLRDGFGAHPVYTMWVAEMDEGIVGISICYIRYSTWKGPMLYLEDLVVTENHRGKGIGKALFLASAQYAHENSMNGMVWQVLDWNTPAIGFYEYFGAEMDPEWINGKLNRKQLAQIIP
ncbi:MAG: GNAT family N-acetyltransferase [Bacteroidetes bacterium]|nr:GNAT family N-acetyltransferase [Bacteroidota bacterium]